MMAVLCVAPFRMEHEMDEEEEVAVALGRQVEGGVLLPYLGDGGTSRQMRARRGSPPW